MRLGIMQPYFFPYLGHFHLINSVDRWIVFDTAQYIRHGWVNRNRILHPKSGWQYITIPVAKHSRDTAIKDIQISSTMDWKGKILGQLKHYEKQAPFYKETILFVEDCLSVSETSLARLDVSILEKVCSRLDIKFDCSYFSEMGLDLGPIESPGDWAFLISRATNATEYVNPPGGAHLFDWRRFEDAGIRLTIQRFENLEYTCGRYDFVPSLSIIDLFMWNPCEKIKKHLNSTFENSVDSKTSTDPLIERRPETGRTT
jgi:hypothetical protein